MRKCIICLSLLAVVFGLCGLSYGAFVYKEDFSGGGSPLHGTAPQTSAWTDLAGGSSSATWTAHSSLLDNGVFPKPVAGSANGVAAVLPFTPVGGNVYELEARFLNNHTRWVAIGFLSLYPNDETSKNYTMMDFAVRHSNSGYVWSLSRNNTGNDQESYNGFRTGSPVPGNGDIVDPTTWVTLKIILDTRPALWTAEYYWWDGYDFIQQGTTQTLTTAIMAGIKNVGISVERRASSEPAVDVTMDYFYLTPEPASLGLLGLGALLLGRRRSA